MKLILLSFLLFLTTEGIKAQSLNVENTFSTYLNSTTKLGINSAYLFHHFIDSNSEVSEVFRNAMIESNFDLVRFPGGAVGNYYNFDKLGYGMVRSEVEDVANTVQCNNSGYYCFTKDENANQNFIHDFVEIIEERFNITGKNTEVLYVLSILQHFVYNLDEINNLDGINNLTELEAAVVAGTISPNFRDRIMNNYNAYQFISSSPNAEIVGVEMGNELYFQEELTTFSFNGTNSNPNFNLASSLVQIDPRITNLIVLIDFYRRILSSIDNDLRIGLSVGSMSYFGSMGNMNLLWNTAIKNRVLSHVDALIPHLYFQIEGSNVSPLVLATNDDDSRLQTNKDEMEKFINLRFNLTMNSFDDFFGITNNDLRLWITEWNTFRNASTTNIWDEWGNTYLHGVFLNKMMEKIALGSVKSNLIEYAILHAWSGSSTSYEHNIISRLTDGTTLNRIGYFSNQTNDFLKSDHVRKLEGSLTTTQNAKEFYTDAFYAYNQSISDACPIEKLIISVNNLRADVIEVNLDFPDNKVTLDTIEYDILSAKLIGFNGLNTASTCGKSFFYTDDTHYDVTGVSDTIVLNQSIQLEGYTSGIYEFEIHPVIPSCLPLDTESLSNEIKLNIFPNPAFKNVLIDLSKNLSLVNSELSITNMLGQKMLTRKIEDQIMNLDIEHFQSGMYFVSIQSETKNYVATFIKQ